MPATTTTCPECGQPAGECYNLCPLSPAFYSPEQEREDDANWSRQDYLNETYGGDIDPEYEQWCADEADRDALAAGGFESTSDDRDSLAAGGF